MLNNPTRRGAPLLSRIARNRLVLVGLGMAVFLILMAVFADVISPRDPLAVDVAAALHPPNSKELFGTDRFGRDLLSRVIHGSRISLGIGFSAVTIALIVGTFLGLISGYFGGVWDIVISRVMDVFFSFPVLLLAIAIAAMLGPGIENAVMAIAIVYAPFFSRVARGPVLAEREKEYVQAARVIGAGHSRILWRHIFPNVLSPVIVQASVTIAYAILTEASLSYLGLGTQPPAPSWGTTLNEGRTYLQLAPWISIFPGIAIMLAVLAFNLVGDGLRDALDPRMC
ncbi:MAG: ABC transporter permease [Chloroflexi bacterium]|nr:ABC transporter permease [Chloroflexota bacterium]